MLGERGDLVRVTLGPPVIRASPRNETKTKVMAAGAVASLACRGERQTVWMGASRPCANTVPTTGAFAC